MIMSDEQLAKVIAENAIEDGQFTRFVGNILSLLIEELDGKIDSMGNNIDYAIEEGFYLLNL